jgi:hypothetical protein
LRTERGTQRGHDALLEHHGPQRRMLEGLCPTHHSSIPQMLACKGLVEHGAGAVHLLAVKRIADEDDAEGTKRRTYRRGPEIGAVEYPRPQLIRAARSPGAAYVYGIHA